MSGLFSAPAVMRLPDCASTPVSSPVAVGHRLDFTSRVTCCEARASNRATETCGLFFIAYASACCRVKDRVPGGAIEGCVLAGALEPVTGEVWVELGCGVSVCGVPA